MRVLKELFGLLIDDARLAMVLLATLAVAFVAAHTHHTSAAGWIIWAGLILSLGYAVEHQYRLKVTDRTNDK